MAFRKNSIEKAIKELVAPGNLLSIWLLLTAITLVHYGAPPHWHWVHDVMRRAYYLPIVIAAMRTGLLGGGIFTVVVVLVYIPHAFFNLHHVDPADGIEKALEIVLYFGVAGVAGFLADKERRKHVQLQRAMDEQRRLNTQLARAGRLAALGEVVAGIAHEIKNPLHALAGTAEVIDSEIAPDSDVREMWELHKSEISRLQKTAERFVSFAQPVRPVVEPLDLRDVATRLLELASAQTRQMKIQLSYASPDEPVMVDGDRDQLAQVGLNIVVNAIRELAETGGHIAVSVAQREFDGTSYAQLRIENDGPAIPASEKEHLFDPFHSGRHSTGLGLSISSRIVQQLGGFIDVSDSCLDKTLEDGRGTAFVVCLKQRE